MMPWSTQQVLMTLFNLSPIIILLILLLLTLIFWITSWLNRLKKRILPITQTIIINICGRIICLLICGILRNTKTLNENCLTKQIRDPDHRDLSGKTTTLQDTITVGPERQGDDRNALTYTSDKKQRLRRVITILQFHKKHNWGDQINVVKLLFCVWWNTRTWKFWLRNHEPKLHHNIRVKLCEKGQFGLYSKLRFQHCQWLRVYESVKWLLARVFLLLVCLLVGGCCLGVYFNTGSGEWFPCCTA